MKEEMNKEEQISIVPLRELSYEDAKREIVAYGQQAGNKKVYISEIAEKLRLDIELIADIIYKLQNSKVV